MKVPFLNLKAPYFEIQEELDRELHNFCKSGQYIGGSKLQTFEDNFANFVEAASCVGLANGLEAIELSLKALGIGYGDEVIVPAHTFIATWLAVTNCGAVPVPVECDPHTYSIDCKSINRAINIKTKAIIPVHLYGQPVDLDPIIDLAKSHNLFVIEDAAQAHGASYKAKRIGSHGDVVAWSFYPGKNLGACGEGGGITTNREDIKDHLHSLRNHGCKVRYFHDEVGYNYRMGGLEGASLNIKLKYINGWNNNRQEIAKRYYEEINNPKIQMQYQPDWAESVFHLFVVIPDDKTAFENHLKANDINPAYHYPVPCHLQKAYTDLGYKRGDFPNAEYLADNCVSLPMYAELKNEQVSRVINVINSN